MSGDAIGSSMRGSVTPSQYTEEPATVPTIVGKGRWGYRQVVAYCAQSRSVQEMRLTICTWSAADPFTLLYRIVTIRNDTGGHVLRASYDPDKLIPDLQQFDEAWKAFCSAGIRGDFSRRFADRARSFGVRLGCRQLDTNEHVLVHFRIKKSLGDKSPILDDDQIKMAIEEQLKANKARLPTGYDLETLVKALREDDLNSRIAADDARAIENYFLPACLAQLIPNLTPQENKELCRSFVEQTVEELQLSEHPAVGKVSACLQLLSDGEVKDELLSSWSGKLISSEAQQFLADLVRALGDDLDRLPALARERRDALLNAITTVGGIDAEDIMTAPHIDTERKYNYLVKLIEADLPNLLPVASIVKETGQDAPYALPVP
jgi:hypothetical protein